MPEFEAFLDPLSRIATRHPDIEAYVLWHKDGIWSDANGETLEAEEITFYAEGLLMEGFGMAWDHLTSAEFGDHIRLCFWQGPAPDMPATPNGTVRVAGGKSKA
ncbi:MAG: hypothetical protein ACK4MS_04360 [Paracoccaceae bacterium]